MGVMPSHWRQHRGTREEKDRGRGKVRMPNRRGKGGGVGWEACREEGCLGSLAGMGECQGQGGGGGRE